MRLCCKSIFIIVAFWTLGEFGDIIRGSQGAACADSERHGLPTKHRHIPPIPIAHRGLVRDDAGDGEVHGAHDVDGGPGAGFERAQEIADQVVLGRAVAAGLGLVRCVGVDGGAGDRDVAGLLVVLALDPEPAVRARAAAAVLHVQRGVAMLPKSRAVIVWQGDVLGDQLLPRVQGLRTRARGVEPISYRARGALQIGEGQE